MLSSRVTRPLVAIRRRLRAQAALEGATLLAAVAAGLLAIAIYLFRAQRIGRHGLLLACAAGGTLIALGALARALGRIPLSRAAARADRSHQLHDRLSSALAFSAEREPTPFMRAAIEDAESVAGRVVAKRAAPFVAPRALRPAAGLALFALVALLIHFPKHAAVAVIAPPPARHFSVDPDLVAVEREAIEALLGEARATGDLATEKVAKQLDQLLSEVDQKQLTRQELFDRLGQIEKQLPVTSDQGETLRKALERAGDELSKRPIARAAGEALKKEDLAQAKAELEKLASRAEKLAAQKRKDGPQPLSDSERKELAASLERAAAQSAEAQKSQAAIDRLKEEQRRLQRQLSQRPNDQNLKRQLQRNQRQLQRLEREQEERAEAQRQLQRLQRDLERAAEQLRNQLSPEAAEALRKAAQQMGSMQDELRKLGNLQKTRIEIGQLKEMLRRAGQSQAQASSGQGQPQQGQGGSGKGQKGAKSLLRDFNQRAGGKSDALLLGQGNTPVLLPLPSGGDGQGQGSPNGPSGNAPPRAGGDGIGTEHDPNLLGDPTKLAAHHQETQLKGKQGAGPSRSETILGSAERGFATRNYQRVYQDYSSVVEEVMSKERVPPGYRYYIKRYFQLIRPRQ